MRCTILLITVICITLITCSNLFADIINVPDDFETIQGGINAAEDGDTVLVQPGEYVENIHIRWSMTVASLFLTTGDDDFITETVIDGNRSDNVITFRDTDDETKLVVLRYSVWDM